MELLLAVLGIVAVLGGVLFSVMWRGRYKEGQSDAREEAQKESDEAKQKADKVLAEHRDPNDVDKRLRDGTF